ncbi:glycoside hydrolase family 2 protein [Sphingomonas lenta]|uniref:Glycoside hydrolase family 2 n=1 Tax=Sphingomonas lenta TaxID=1141887 RepID=A0A2A2SER6_9SPHN|nr:sugar-binding domain-containing protein [Sphingomonas lenta]PAX07739.1 glycoside hydrolase family 2 [Sphingomonas lenta]
MAEADPRGETSAFHRIDPGAYPRPQLRREGWVDLCGSWGFAHDDGDRGVAERWFEGGAPAFDRAIIVPFPPESRASGIGDPDFHPIVWYRRTIRVGPAQRTGRVLLHFGAVDYRARVWVNGRLAIEHEGGHTPFSADITGLLEPGPEQVVVVRAEDLPDDLGQPRGKQYWQEKPDWIWYHRTTGIWQPVWLEPVPTARVAELRWTPDLDRFGVDLTVRFDGAPPEGARLRVRLWGDRPRRLLADDSYLVGGSELSRTILLDPNESMRSRWRLTWAPHHPRLVDAELTLEDGTGRPIDRVESYFGLRSVEARDGRFLLNGSPVFMRLVLAQNYWPDTHLAAPSADALREEVLLAKSMGFNGLRIHQKIEDPRFLYWCDKLGMMVWGEAANAFVFHDRAVERLSAEWMAAVRRDYSHPCIVAWVPLNESWGVPNLDHDPRQRSFTLGLYHLTRALDGTRPVIGNDGWSHAAGDLFGVHDYAPDAATLGERYGSREAIERTFAQVRPHHAPLLSGGHALSDEPVVVSEFGGLTFKPEVGETWFGYGTHVDADALLAHYAELTGALLDSTALAGFCYTQLTDTEQETNGLATVDRVPKIAPEKLRAVNGRPSRAVPSEILDAVMMAEVERRRAAGRDGR